MTAEELRNHAGKNDAPEAGWPLEIQALWWQARGDWHKAHELCQKAASRTGDWVHAHLHRVEGDESNASYWYSRAGREAGRLAQEVEWEHIAAELLEELL